MLQDESLLDFKDVMRYLKVSRSTVNRLIDTGVLTGGKVGEQWRFRKQDVEACVRPHTVAQAVA